MIVVETTINEIFENLRYLENALDVEKVININEKTTFYSDQLRINVILGNLISNALKYQDPMKEKMFIKIDIHVEPMFVKIIVEDNGIGINEDALPKIFDMFFRATTQSKGSGLGLYIVKESIMKLHGKIRVESKERTFTRFHIEIPNNKPEDVKSN